MKVIITGRNRDIAPIQKDLQCHLDRKCVRYTVRYSGGDYTTSKGEVLYHLEDCSIKDFMPYNSKNICIEVVEEAPDAIYSYKSDFGATKFKLTVTEREMNTDMLGFEDYESYYARMQEMGVRL